MKYNAHIYLLGFRIDLYRLFSFWANAKFKDITGIVNHHYHVFHMPQLFYSVNNQLLNHLLITLDLQLCKHCISSDPLTSKINGCQTWLGNTTGVRFSQLALCIPRSPADIFTHIILEKYLRPRNDHIIMESALYRTAL